MNITIENLFNPKRFFNLCKLELFNNRKIYLLKDIIIVAVFFNMTLFSNLMNSSQDPFDFFIINLFVGIIITSLTFGIIHNKESGITYLMIPCSMEEKFLVKFLFTTVLYFLSAIISIFIASLISETVRMIFFKTVFNFFNPIERGIFNVLLTYIYFHSIFFFGSIIFKKNNFLMTVLSLAILFFGFMIIMSILAVNVFSIVFTNLKNPFEITNFFNTNSNIIFQIFKIIFLYLIPPVLYVLSYLKFKKIELK
ncbi:MAG TPA: hypothetical protein PK771_00700 [Spirochaetota bacterium]|nr:hypothetical protein [Spirochaetota bacterium]